MSERMKMKPVVVLKRCSTPDLESEDYSTEDTEGETSLSDSDND